MMPRQVAAFGAAALACPVLAQNTLPSFEVASVKVVRPSDHVMMSLRGGPGTSSPGRITWEGTVLMPVLTKAYEVGADQIKGPGWLMSDLFSITAVVPPDTDLKRLGLMFQRLLEDRFHLKVHRERKEFPAYDLVTARGGSKMKRVQPDAVPPGARAPIPVDSDPNGLPILGNYLLD